MVHYIPLRKDFSNFSDVIEGFRDPELRRVLTENAYRDLIASDRYSYRALIESFDEDMLEAGLEPGISEVDSELVRAALRHGRWRREGRGHARWTYHQYLSPGAMVFQLRRLGRRMRRSAAD